MSTKGASGGASGGAAGDASRKTRTPGDIARRIGAKTSARGDLWRRETFTLPRPEARARAREWFDRYPKAAYMTEIEFWRELENDCIEFTIRRLPSAD